MVLHILPEPLVGKYDVQWNDIDYVVRRNDFTYDKVNFKGLDKFVDELRKLPFGPPPVCPDALKQLEQYLLDIEQLPTYNYEKSHKFWSREPQLSTLLNFSPSFATTLKPERDPKTGELLRFKEVFVTDFGDVDEFNDKSSSNPANNEISIDFENLMSTPPGMKCGCDFNVVDTQQFPVLPAKKNVINLTNILQVEDSLGLTIQEKKKDVKKEEIKETKQKPVAKVVNIDTEEQEEVIPVESSIPVLKISETPSLKVLEKADWAEELAVKLVLDFKERVPKMAYKWDFELDPFQQLIGYHHNNSIYFS
ncbi:superkiller complex protein 2-like [Lycorma delicatula]|uniref:superkiller complex protein 2-like n=1 Tax=Lycorma delicatula TaxID=130591 RepID=UPI003F51A818